MKKILEKQAVFNATLIFFTFFAKRPFFTRLTQWFTTLTASLNLKLNKTKASKDIEELAQTWQALMPPDGQEHFKINEIKGNTAFAQIHLHCPLRGTGNVKACYKLKNYDRKLMDKVGGELIVLESQSNSGKHFCQLAIRPKGADTSDLIPAHLRT